MKLKCNNKEKNSEPTEFFITHDVWLASAITILLETSPDYRVENGKTLFLFPQDEKTYKAISAYNSGIPINSYLFAETCKRLRAEMLMRRGG